MPGALLRWKKPFEKNLMGSVQMEVMQSRATSSAKKSGALPCVLILARSGVTIKNLLFGPFLPTLRDKAQVTVLTDCYDDPQLLEFAEASGASLAPYIYSDFDKRRFVGRLESFLVASWDRRGVSRTRLSKRRLLPQKPRNSLHASWLFGLKLAQKAIAPTRFLETLDEMVEDRLLREHPTESMIEQLKSWMPDIVLSTLPHRPCDMAIARAARRLGVRVLACFTSWDNLTSKDRITFTYDGYLLWSEQMRAELHTLYERAREKPWWIVGAPNFDVHFDPRWRLTREGFCRSVGLDPAKKIILYGTGSRGLAPEYLLCERLAMAVREGKLGNAQLLLRLHPLNDDPSYQRLGQQFPEVVIRYPGQTNLGMLPGSPSPTREGIVELVNSLLHADVVVNLASTLSIDAALLDRPIVNVDYDPIPLAQEKSRIKDAYTVYDHYQPIVKSGGVRLARSEGELLQEVNRYLIDPKLDQEGRRRIVEIEVALGDGRAGERVASLLLKVAEKETRRSNGKTFLPGGIDQHTTSCSKRSDVGNPL